MNAKAFLTAAVLAGALTFPIQAQQESGEDDRGVARISVINGDVSVKRGDSGDLVAAGTNAPLMVQDSLLTGPSSRAEIQFNYANAIRVGASSEVRLGEVSYGRYQVQVAAGTTTFRVLRQNQSQVEIATPTVAVRPLGPGTYRVSVFEDGSSEITVRSGAADISTARGSERVEAGQTLIARGSPQDPEFQVTAAIPMDEWDRYNQDRDREIEASRSYQYVSPDVTGAEDLDRYGQWENVAPYGQVWVPTVDPGWAPYRSGRWVWEDWYGWTWVSYDPWGWAPYHYGRWFWGGSRWCWYPGGFGRHYWSPALVAFFGFGNAGFGVGFGWGNVGWVPLAPFEAFHPWWGRGYYGGGNINNVTIVNNTNITNIYSNARVANGITAVPANDFGRGRITNGNLVRVGQGEIARANLIRGQLPLTPGRESLALSDRAVRTANLPRVNPNTQFFSRVRPQPVQRIPFEQQRQSVEAVARRTFGNAAVPAQSGRGIGQAPGRPAAPRSAGLEPSRGNAYTPGRQAYQPGPAGTRTYSSPAPTARPVNPSSGGWHRFGEPAPAARPAPQYPSAGQAPSVRGPSSQDGGWRRFGEPAPYRPAPSPRTDTYRSPAPAPAPRTYAPPARTYSPPDRSERGYQRFGQAVPRYEPRSEPRYEPRGSYTPPTRPESGYQRFGQAVPRSEPRYEPRSYGSWPSRGEPSRMSAPAPVRINPPIVSPRSAPSYSAPRSQSRPAPAPSRGSESRGRR